MHRALPLPASLPRIDSGIEWALGMAEFVLLSRIGVAEWDETSVSSPRKVFVFIIYKYLFWINISSKYLICFWQQKHCRGSHAQSLLEPLQPSNQQRNAQGAHNKRCTCYLLAEKKLQVQRLYACACLSSKRVRKQKKMFSHNINNSLTGFPNRCIGLNGITAFHLPSVGPL